MTAPHEPFPHLEDAIHAYESGDGGCRAVAKMFNIPEKRLRDTLVERGTFLAGKGNRTATLQGEATRLLLSGLPTGDICDAYLAGVSENELAKTHGIPRTKVGTILRYAGIPRRDQATANRLMVAARTPEENVRNTEAAHAAVRGVKHTWDRRCASAQRRHGQPPAVATELLYAAWLRLRGIATVPQHAIGPYNCDLGAEPVAVEIFGGNWHGHGKHAAKFAERGHYILDQGWALVIVWVDQVKQCLTEASADYLAAFVEEARRDPSLRGQYRVVWGDGEEVPTAGKQLDDFASVPPRRGRTDSRG